MKSEFDMEVSTNVWFEDGDEGEGWYYSVFVVYRTGNEDDFGDEQPFAWGYADTRQEAIEEARFHTAAVFNGE